MAATSAVLFMGMLLFLYIRTDLALYLNLVGSIILIVTCCLFAAATSKSPLGVNASAIGIASGAINMLF
jgi:hypothetical protein